MFRAHFICSSHTISMASPMTTGYEFWYIGEPACNRRNVLILYQKLVSCQSGSNQILAKVVFKTIKIAPAGRVFFLHLFPKVSAGKVVLERISIEIFMKAVC